VDVLFAWRQSAYEVRCPEQRVIHKANQAHRSQRL
jgi:hypothetical protein